MGVQITKLERQQELIKSGKGKRTEIKSEQWREGNVECKNANNKQYKSRMRMNKQNEMETEDQR